MSVMIERVEGMINAAPIPIAARVPINSSGELAHVDPAEAMAKMTIPTNSASLRPKRSPRAPMVSRRPANTRT